MEIRTKTVETEEGIAQAIIRGKIDFQKDTWQKVSEEAKLLVKNMLDPNPYNRLTVEEVLDHPWIRNANEVSDVPLGENVGLRIKQFTLMNKFKKKVLRVVADNLPDEQIEGIRQIFNMMDTDNNGDLTFEELRDGLLKIGHQVTDPDVHMLIDAADVDGSGTLNCDEFVMVSVHLKKISSDELLAQAFSYFDKNNSNYIEFDELKEALLDDQLGPANEQVIQDIIFDVDLDKDGRISYEEFKAMMKTGMDWKMASRQYSRAMLNWAFLVQDSRNAWISFGPTPVAFVAHEGWRGLAARDVDFIQKILIPCEIRCPRGILISSSHGTL
ncbi:hypothetical protein ACLB2K_035290 [Fragaria x ananassa]